MCLRTEYKKRRLLLTDQQTRFAKDAITLKGRAGDRCGIIAFRREHSLQLGLRTIRKSYWHLVFQTVRATRSHKIKQR